MRGDEVGWNTGFARWEPRTVRLDNFYADAAVLDAEEDREGPDGKARLRMRRVELRRELESLVGAVRWVTHLDGTPVVMAKQRGPEPQRRVPVPVLVGTKMIIVLVPPRGKVFLAADSVAAAVAAERPGYRAAASRSRAWKDVIAAVAGMLAGEQAGPGEQVPGLVRL